MRHEHSVIALCGKAGVDFNCVGDARMSADNLVALYNVIIEEVIHELHLEKPVWKTASRTKLLSDVKDMKVFVPNVREAEEAA